MTAVFPRGRLGARRSLRACPTLDDRGRLKIGRRLQTQCHLVFPDADSAPADVGPDCIRRRVCNPAGWADCRSAAGSTTGEERWAALSGDKEASTTSPLVEPAPQARAAPFLRRLSGIGLQTCPAEQHSRNQTPTRVARSACATKSPNAAKTPGCSNTTRASRGRLLTVQRADTATADGIRSDVERTAKFKCSFGVERLGK